MDPVQEFGFGGSLDQAAGLRRWAEQQSAVQTPEPSAERSTELPTEAAPPAAVAPLAPPRMLMLVGPSNKTAQLPQLGLQTLARWQAKGHSWVGDLAQWRLVPMAADSPHLHALAGEQARWGLWVDADLDGFRRAYLTLRRLSEAGGPSCLLVLHPGFVSHEGLLNNLRDAAARFLGIQLLLIDEQPGYGAF